MDTINKWLTLAANVGVLVGIFFVGYELRQTNQFVQAQTRQAISDATIDELFRLAESEHLLSAAAKANSNQPLSLEEETSNLLTVAARMRRWENMHYQYRIGLYSAEEMAGNIESWATVMCLPRFRDFWDARRAQFNPDFADTIDRVVKDRPVCARLG